MDGAPWHRSYKLKIPSNIEIVYLPPYSPELNPIERFWLHIKRHTIKNKFYDSIKDLENDVARFVVDIHHSLLASICSCNYLFN